MCFPTAMARFQILMTKEATRCQEVVIGVATTASAGHAPSTTKKMIDEDQLARMLTNVHGTPKETLRVDKEDP